MGRKLKHSWQVSLLLITFLGLTHVEAWGADWRFCTQSKDGTIYYYDATRITRVSNGVLKFWGKTILSPEAVKKFVKIDPKFEDLHHIISLIEMNCTERKRRSLWIILYDKKGAAIENEYITGNESNWEMILPESAQEDLLDALCE